MDKNATYKEKYSHLKDWMPFIIESIKKDLKNEHLKKDIVFVKEYLSSKNPAKVSTEEFAEAYSRAIANEEKGDALGEFIASRWLLKHSEIYDFFESELTRISPDFTNLEELDMPTSQALIEASSKQFGAPNTYLFAILNSVVFPKEAFKQLQAKAEQETKQKQEQKVFELEKANIEKMQRSFEQEMARLTDKYEKKLAGLQKKYTVDVENLKKQVASLQRKLQEVR